MTQSRPHPYRKQTTRQIVAGALFGVVGALALLVPGGIALALSFWALAALFITLAVRARGQLEAVQVNNVAFDLMSRGKLHDAERVLATLGSPKGYVGRAVDIQRTVIAMRRGELDAAEAHATRAIEQRVGIFAREFGAQQEASAYALRAMARASKGDAAGAAKDVEIVRAHSHHAPDALGRARVAEAIAAARADDRERLAAILRTGRGLDEFIAPRERSLMRAFRRMVQVGGRSVYREPARPAESHEEPVLGEWVAKIAPQAAAFVEEGGHSAQMQPVAPPAAPPPGVAAGSTAVAATAKPQRRVVATLVLWVVLIVLFIAIWQLLSPAGGGSTAPVVPPPEQVGLGVGPIVALVGPLFVGLMFLLIGVNLRAQRKAGRSLRQAQLASASGDDAAAERALFAFVRPGRPKVGSVNAYATLSMLSERRCSFEEALARCDEGIRAVSISAQTRALHSDILVPDLVTQRAALLAMLDRPQEAEAELAALAREFSTYPFMTRAMFRVRMLLAVRRGDFEGAAKLARERTPELPLALRDEMLADLVIAASGAHVPEGEVERILAELRDDAQLGPWIDRVAPGLRNRVAQRARAGQANARIAESAPAQSAADEAGEAGEDEHAGAPGAARA